MLLSRVWFLLCCLVGAVVTILLLAVGRTGVNETVREQERRLLAAQDVTHLWLQGNSRTLMDAMAKVAQDGKLQEALDQFARHRAAQATADAELVHRNVAERLGGFAEQLKAEMLVIVDVAGKVAARVGPEEKIHGDGLVGYPLVRDALRGYLGDDSWEIDGKLYRMAASPVIARRPDRIVGAVIIGRIVDEAFCNKLKKWVGTDVAFLVRDRVVASSTASSAVFAVPSKLGELRSSLEEHGRSNPVIVEGGGKRYTAALGAMRGDTGASVLYAVILPRQDDDGWRAMLAWFEQGKLSFGQPPWVIVGAWILAIFIGLGLIWLEHVWPLRRLTRSSRALGSGEAAKLDEEKFRGSFGAIARSVNQGIERAARGSPLAPRSLAAILDRVATPGQGMPPLKEKRKSPVVPSAPPAVPVPPPPAAPAAAPPQPVAAPRPATPTAVPPPPPAPPPPAPPPAARPAAPRPAPSGPPTAAPAGVVGAPKADAGPDADLRRVYDEFQEARRRLGEHGEVPFDRFAARLRASRDQLMQKMGLRAVRFEVYVKEGKAAVKATPDRK